MDAAVLGAVDATTRREVVVVEPGGTTLVGIVVVGWTIVGLAVVVVVVGRAIRGVVVDEPTAANPMSPAQSLAELPPSHESDGRSPAAVDAGVTTENAATTQETRTQLPRGSRAREHTDSIVRSGMLGLSIVPPQGGWSAQLSASDDGAGTWRAVIVSYGFPYR